MASDLKDDGIQTEDRPPALTPREEAEMQKEIDLALEPYRGVVSPEMLAQMREMLEEEVRRNPHTRQLIERIARPAPVQKSTEVTKEGVAPKNGKKRDGQEGA